MDKKRFELLTDEQWKLIEPLLPEMKRRKDNRGRPWASNRACLEGILWVLRTGAPWRFLPAQYPSPATCWRRLKVCFRQRCEMDEPVLFLLGRSRKDAAQRGSSDVDAAGDLGFAEPGVAYFQDFTGVLCCSCGPPKALAVLSGMSESGPHTFPLDRGVSGPLERKTGNL